MRHQEWRRIVQGIAEKVGGTVEDRGSKLVIRLPGGGFVWCASTPSKPTPDRVERDIRREMARGRR